MSEHGIATLSKGFLRAAVAERLGWKVIPAHAASQHGPSTGYPPNKSHVWSLPDWDRDLVSALELMREFRKRYDNKSEAFQARTYINLDVCTDLSGSVEWRVWGSDVYGYEGFRSLIEDGPAAICRAFLLASLEYDKIENKDVGV